MYAIVTPRTLFAAALFCLLSAHGVRADCLREPVEVRHRHRGEAAQLVLTDCQGNPYLPSLTELSLIARAWGSDRPSDEQIRAYARANPERSAAWVTSEHRRLHPGLLTRLQALADAFRGSALVVVSGYRPGARSGSRHRVGRAIDVEVEGIHRRRVARYAAETLRQTGVGYYPNSTFSHIDVRERSYQWVDESGPGQAARYTAWPSAWATLDRPNENRVSDARAAEAEQRPRQTVRSTRNEHPNETAPEPRPAVASARRTASPPRVQTRIEDTIDQAALRAQIQAAFRNPRSQQIARATPASPVRPTPEEVPGVPPAATQSRIEVRYERERERERERREGSGIDWSLPSF